MWFDLWFYCDFRNFKFQNCDWSGRMNFLFGKILILLYNDTSWIYTTFFQPVKAFYELFEPVKNINLRISVYVLVA